MKKSLLASLIFSLASLQVLADDSAGHPDFKAAKAACESSQFNTAGITLPERPAPGQRPQLTDQQRALIEACKQAGILPQHHHHSPPPGDMGGREPSSPPPSDQ